MLQRIHGDFTRWREDMNFMLEWREQYASDDFFFVVDKATNRLNRTLFVFYPQNHNQPVARNSRHLFTGVFIVTIVSPMG